jgi:hypothetical protein
MKLPTYQSGAVQSLDTVDPSVYRELGRSQVQFAGALQGGAEALTDHYVKVSTADRLRGEAELRIKAQELNTFVERNENVPIDMVPKNLRTAQNTRTIVDEEGNTQQYIPSRLIAEDWRKQILGDEAKRISEGARTRLGKDWIRESWEMDIAPRSEAALSEIVYRQEEVAAQAEFEEAGQALIDAGDAEGFARHLEAGNVNNIIDEKQYKTARRNGLEQIQANSYTRVLNDPNARDDILRTLADDIASDKLLSEPKRLQLEGQARRAWHDRNVNMVGEALAERNVDELQSLRDYYAKDQGKAKEHPSKLDGQARNTLINRIDNGLKAMRAGDGAAVAAESARAKELLAQARKSLEAGGNVRPSDYVFALEEQLDKAHPPGSSKEADIRARMRSVQFAQSAPEMENMALEDGDARAQRLASEETNSDGSLEDKLRLDALHEWNDTIDTQLEENPLKWGQQYGIIDSDYAYNPQDIAGSLQTEMDLLRTVGENYGLDPQLVGVDTANKFRSEYVNTDGNTRLQMMMQVREAYGDDPTLLEKFTEQAMPDGRGHEWVGMSMLAKGELEKANAIHYGGEYRRKNKAALEEAGFVERDARASLAADVHALYPATSGDRIEAIMDMTAYYITRGMSAMKAEAAAKQDILGDAVKSSGSGAIVRPPVDGMKQKEFRAEQQRTLNRTYKDAGYTGNENMRELVSRGDVVFRSSEAARGQYHLYDTRVTGANGLHPALLDKDGRRIVINWDDRSLGPRARKRAPVTATGQTYRRKEPEAPPEDALTINR